MFCDDVQLITFKIPRQLGRFQDGKLSIYKDVKITEDVVFKVNDLDCGIGDKFLKNGIDFNTKQDLEQLLLEDKEMHFKVNLIAYLYSKKLVLTR